MSKNPLILNNVRSVRQNDEVPVGDGTWIGVKDLNPGEGPFLVLRLTIRTQGEVNSEGSLLTEFKALQEQRATNSLQVAQTTSRLPSLSNPVPVGKSEALLECVFAAGRDIQSIPPNARCIGLPLDTPVEIGRECQPGFFEYLLNNEPRWCSYLSRRHCELTLSASRPWWGFGSATLTLAVENLSGNIVFLQKQPLAKNEWDELPEGGILAFAAASDGVTIKFLQFKLRKIESGDLETLMPTVEGDMVTI